MRQILLSVTMLTVVVGPLAAAAGDSSSAYALLYSPVRQITCTASTTWTITGMRVKEWYWYNLLPPTTPRQHITMSVVPTAAQGSTQGEVQHPLLFIRKVFSRPQNGVSCGYEVVYQGTLYRTQLVQLKPGAVHRSIPDLSAREQELYTARTDPYDFDSAVVSNWLNRSGLRRKSDERDLDFGRRVFMNMCTTFKYGPNHAPNNTASAVVTTHMGVCGGLSTAFCAALRASGVPCRVLVVQQVGLGGNVGGSDWGHATNEFFCQGIGWVPCDLTGGCSAGASRNMDAAATWFGQEDGATLMEFNDESDFTVDTVKFGSRQPQPSGDDRQGCSQAPSPETTGFWGFEVAGNGNGKTTCTSRFYARVWTDPQAYETMSPDGEPGARVAKPPAFLVWRDANRGWHIRTTGDGKSHNYQMSVYAEQAVGQGQSFQPGETETATLAQGYIQTGSMDTDVAVPAGTVALRFELTLDNREAPEFIAIGAKGAHPARDPFTMAVQ